MITVMRVAELGELRELQLPERDAGAQRDRLKVAVGGISEAAYYHPSTTVYVHGGGRAEQLRPNPAAWALDSSWMRAEPPYLLYGL